MVFIVELVSVSMEKCYALMYGIEDSFFYTPFKKRSSYYFYIIFPEAQSTAT